MLSRGSILALFFLLSAISAFAQTDRGSITGRVTDPNGAGVADAKADPYKVTAEAQGFKTASAENIVVAVQVNRTLDFKLEIGEISSVVTISNDEAPVLQTETPVRQTNMTERQVKELPLLVSSEFAGRTPLSFIYIDSNVTQASGAQGTDTTRFRVSGGQALGTEILIDGATTRRTQNGTFFSEVAPGPNAFQEFTLSTSTYSAEFGNSSGGVVNFTQKSGGNEYHGEVYDLIRNEVFNANTFRGNAQGLDRARDNQNDFGFNIGGPITLPHFGEGGPIIHVDAYTNRGVIAANANNLKEAERQFAAAASLAPSDPSTRNNYGAILMRLGRTAEAQTQFEASLKLNPDQPSALTNLAQIYFDRGQPDDLRMALSLFERAAKNSSDAEISRAFVITCLKLGQVLMKKGDLRGAGRILESAVASGIDDARIYAALAEVYEADGHYENAIPAMRLAVQRDPRNESYRVRYGLLLTDSHAPAAGIVRLQEALKQFPSSARLWLALGIAQLTYGQNTDAESSFNRSLALDRKLVPALAYLGVTYAERGQYEKAIGFYEQAIALNAQIASLHYLVADTILKTSNADTSRAEKYLRRATQLDPKLAAAYLSWGRLYVRTNRYSEAPPLLERAVTLQPDLVEAHYQLSRVLVKLKRTDEANRELQIFKELSEKQKARNESREIVRRLANIRF